MSDGIDFDFSELDQLAADVSEVPSNAGPNIRTAVTVTALKIKRDWQEPLKGSVTLPALPYALDFDITSDASLAGSEVAAEIGFNLEKNQGPLGGISEYGSPTITGRGFGLAALEKNAADFEYGLDLALEQAEQKAGL